MLRTLTAVTFEIDSPEDAAAEIFEQINPEATLLTNSVGIIACTPDFLTSGAVKAICEKLPFPVVGATSTATAANSNQGADLLSLMVFTSDKVTFTAVLTEPLNDNAPEKVQAAYQEALTKAGGPPSLILPYFPLLPHFGGVRLVHEMNKISGNIPLFGTISLDAGYGVENAYTIFNGEHHHSCGALLLMRGDVNPRFHVITVSEASTSKQKGVITDSEGCLLKSVNDMPCLEYMASIGLNRNDGLEGIASIPFLVDYNDGSPVSGRTVYSFTPEGYAMCGGEMPTEGTFTAAQMDAREVTNSSGKLLRTLIAEENAQGLLILSCGGRALVLGVEPDAEMDMIRSIVGDAVPMHMSYSGGEICPVHTDENTTVNRFHNYTLVACVF